jgi:hypothetical protein
MGLDNLICYGINDERYLSEEIKIIYFVIFNNPKYLGTIELKQMYNQYIQDNKEQLDRIESLLNESYKNVKAIEMYVNTFSSNKMINFLYPSNIKTLC